MIFTKAFNMQQLLASSNRSTTPPPRFPSAVPPTSAAKAGMPAAAVASSSGWNFDFISCQVGNLMMLFPPKKVFFMERCRSISSCSS